MTQSSVAVSVDGRDWAILNASPDIRQQLAATPVLHPRALRQSPVKAVVLTNADVDHVAGLLTLREKTPFTLFASRDILSTLEGNSIFQVLDPGLVGREVIALDTPFELIPGLRVTPFAVPGKVALYLEGERVALDEVGEQTVALRLEDDTGTAVYMPGCAALPDWVLARLTDADVLMVDGTVWEDDDMPRSGTGQKTGARMGHVAMNGPGGSLSQLSNIPARKIFIHINNTNPVLQPDSAERRAVESAGWEVAHDGMEVRT